MKVNWKQLAQSPGYKSLKAAYIRDVQRYAKHPRPMRNKEEYLQLFRKVIARAQHHSIRTGEPIEAILKNWESNRDYGRLNYYQDRVIGKLPSGRPRNIHHQKPETYLKNNSRTSSIDKFKRIREEKTRFARLLREHELGKKPRWSTERKKREAKHRKYRSL